MPIELSMQTCSSYLRFEVRGERVPGELASHMLDVWSQVADRCRSAGITRVLSVSKLTGPYGLMDMYRLAAAVPGVLQPSGCEIVACVTDSDSPTLETYRFGEDVSVNRGLKLRTFSSESEAIDWLQNPELS